MSQIERVRTRHITLMQKTCATLGSVLTHVSQEQATTLRDGPDGWTVLEVVCHLRDYDDIFYERTLMMRDQDSPDLPGYDHEALVVERNYNAQNLEEVYTTLAQSRQRFVAFFEGLNETQWEKTGIHPERGPVTMLDALIQVGHHDANHIEQITRILTQTE